MNPAPAISTLAIDRFAAAPLPRLEPACLGSGGCFGQTHGEIAGEIAMLCIAGILDFDADPAGVSGHQFLRQRIQGVIEQCFDQSFQKSIPNAKAAQFTAKRSIDFQRINIDRPPQPFGPWQFLDFWQPTFEKALQRGAHSRFDQQVRAEMIGPPCDQCRSRPQNFQLRLARRAAGLGSRRARMRPGPRCPWPRRAATRDARKAAIPLHGVLPKRLTQSSRNLR